MTNDEAQMSNQAQNTNDKSRGGGTGESPSPKSSPVKGEEIASASPGNDRKEAVAMTTKEVPAVTKRRGLFPPARAGGTPDALRNFGS
jgi:hypothetical protein